MPNDPASDFDPDAYLKAPESKGFDPDIYLKSKDQGFWGQMGAAVTDIPSEIYGAGKQAVGAIAEGLNPFSESRHASYERMAKAPTSQEAIGEQLSQLGSVGKGLAGIPQAVAAPITGAARSAIGHPYSALTGIPYEEAKSDVDLAMMGLSPGKGVNVPKTIPPPNLKTGPFGVVMSEGQATGELPLIQTEQAALRGNMGVAAEKQAKEFARQQQAQVAGATERVSRSFDPFHTQIAETPAEAAGLAQSGIQQSAAIAKKSVNDAYTYAKAQPGEIHIGAIESLPQQIRGSLSVREEPVIVDQNTPNALRMMNYLDEKVGQFKIPNAADPYRNTGLPPNPTGVNLTSIDQWRKSLSAFRRDAYRNPMNAMDQRATQAIMDTFDTHIDNAVNNGLFSGNKSAVEAWNTARAAHSDYRGTFRANRNDPVGRVMEKIIGINRDDPAIPNKVADYLYGSAGTVANDLNVGVANRTKRILGENSPEWLATKQGLFARLTETPEGVTDFTSKRIADNIYKFLNGKGAELSKSVYSPAERDLIRSIADLHRQIQVPQAGANWSNTATFTQRMLHRLSGWLGMVVGASIARTALPGLHWGVSELLGAGMAKGAGKFVEAMDARRIARQMPTITGAMKRWQNAIRLDQTRRTTLGVTAAINLDRAIRPLGGNLQSIFAGQGVQSAPAQERQE